MQMFLTVKKNETTVKKNETKVKTLRHTYTGCLSDHANHVLIASSFFPASCEVPRLQEWNNEGRRFCCSVNCLHGRQPEAGRRPVRVL